MAHGATADSGDPARPLPTPRFMPRGSRTTAEEPSPGSSTAALFSNSSDFQHSNPRTRSTKRSKQGATALDWHHLDFEKILV